MKILAFETSCDDTAVAVVEDGTIVLASVRVSQVEHEVWGGVVPEIAARLHAENWKVVLEACLAKSSLSIEDIDAIACTKGPGLQTSLLTGTTAASFLSQLYNKPLIPVHHIYGHICSVFLQRDIQDILFPSLTFTVSGGHTEIYYGKDSQNYQCIGKTRDDAAGEAFDKVAKMLGLGYPGGPLVSKRAEEGSRKKYNLPVPNLGKDSLEFSFSGVKAAVRRLVDKEKETFGRLSEVFIADVCASFEDVVARIFIKRLRIALEKYPEAKMVSLVGGVSANAYLKKEISLFLQRYGITFLTPKKLEYSTDNAAMIGAAAYFIALEENNDFPSKYIEAVPRLTLSD